MSQEAPLKISDKSEMFSPLNRWTRVFKLTEICCGQQHFTEFLALLQNSDEQSLRTKRITIREEPPAKISASSDKVSPSDRQNIQDCSLWKMTAKIVLTSLSLLHSWFSKNWRKKGDTSYLKKHFIYCPKLVGQFRCWASIRQNSA